MPMQVNFSKAQDITKERLRADRTPLLEAQDILFMKAQEAGSDTSAIVEEKQRLRDITNQVDDMTTLDELKTVTKVVPSDTEMKTMLFGWKVLKHVKSNAILLVKNNETVGIGAGQVSRVDSVNIALKKSGERLDNSILCSDAFFPFRDSIDKIVNTGIVAVIQPGGSVRDQEVIAACNDHGIAMVFTGRRCFKH